MCQLQQLIHTLQQAGGAGLPQPTAPPPEQKPSLAKVSSLNLNGSIWCCTTILTTHTSLYICLGNEYVGIVESGRYQPYLTVLMLYRNHRVNVCFRAINSLPVALCFWFDSVSARSIWLWWWPWTCGGKDWTSPCCSIYHVGHNKLSFLSVHIQFNLFFLVLS